MAPTASKLLKEFKDAWEDDLITIILLRRYRRKRKLRELQMMTKRRFWVRDIYLNRPTLGAYGTLFKELHADREYFFRYIRMSPDRFQHLLSLVAEDIIKDTTNCRVPVSPEERLALTLRFLASGESQQSLCYSFRLGKSTVSKIVAETCSAIYLCLKDTYLKSPQSTDEWQNIASSFEEQWNFPHVIGALDGKHIRIECPKQTGSLYHNYKGFFSIVLLALCDSDYCFTYYDLGSYGSNNDSGILAVSEMGEAFEYGDVNLPEPTPVEGCKFSPLPYFILGDDIFPLKPWLL